MNVQEFFSFVASLFFLGVGSYLFSRWHFNRLTLERYRKILTLAEEAVLFVEDAFPEKKGVEKLKEAIQYLKEGCERLGILLGDSEAEARVRIAYQRLERKK
ncbi:MAG: phage holin, LLH family [Candidatus Caldatribacterium sp.]|uniref:phage holin, LLH family n=1 Tax=Candidatus Caldatribacterium sp. TaxID=2282143 RepID=UPI0029996063|nr:phage holin, LLH family [Candidatus Caldatribacterium sp.]MCX7730170.1 phage holin, LLH family [Candidatus Caldatribacterium sp.]MDW8081736.1 phage holin, LLH family [Candidatus Calescibacterium sp.]